MSTLTKISQLLGRGPRSAPQRIQRYLATGREPWSEGYLDHRWAETGRALRDDAFLAQVRAGAFPPEWGLRLDERVAEYPWIFAHLRATGGRCLDAGSTFNFEPIATHPAVQARELTIFTMQPEEECYAARRISYVYGDLRQMPFRDGWFDEVVCQSTLEHIGMDNSMYGPAEAARPNPAARAEYLLALGELIRVLKPGGQLLLTFPCGRYEDHGFFQQFDAEMIAGVEAALAPAGRVAMEYLLYRPTGWNFASAAEVADARSFNPHSGKGKGDDGAAHCRAICCLKLIKNSAV